MLTGPEFKDWGKGPTLISASGERCFYCGKPCYDAGWMWSRETGQEIYMHVTCAVTFGIRLMRDVYEYQKKEGKLARTT